MKTKLLIFALFSLLLVNAQAGSLNTCVYVGKSTTPIFTNCISENFKKIKVSLGLDTTSCINFGEHLDFGFKVCTTKNFHHIKDRLRLKLRECVNLEEEVNPFYVGCVQQNFKEIQKQMPAEAADHEPSTWN